MRIAIMSDIHGFDLALRSVLEDIDASGPFDAIVAAGDLCETGPRPDEVVRILREREIRAVEGNTDVGVIKAAQGRDDEPNLRYAAERLGNEGVAWLAALPFEIRFTPPGATGHGDDLLIVHANPHNLEDSLAPDCSDEQLLKFIEPVDAAMIAFGHVHICYIREVGRYLLMDVSAVGNSKNGDLSSKWGIAAWDDVTRTWSAELHRVPYPLEATKTEIRECGVPNAKKVIRKLEAASYQN